MFDNSFNKLMMKVANSVKKDKQFVLEENITLNLGGLVHSLLYFSP